MSQIWLYFESIFLFLMCSFDYVQGRYSQNSHISFIDHTQQHKYSKININNNWAILVSKKEK